MRKHLLGACVFLVERCEIHKLNRVGVIEWNRQPSAHATQLNHGWQIILSLRLSYQKTQYALVSDAGLRHTRELDSVDEAPLHNSGGAGHAYFRYDHCFPSIFVIALSRASLIFSN